MGIEPVIMSAGELESERAGKLLAFINVVLSRQSKSNRESEQNGVYFTI